MSDQAAVTLKKEKDGDPTPKGEFDYITKDNFLQVVSKVEEFSHDLAFRKKSTYQPPGQRQVARISTREIYKFFKFLCYHGGITGF